jgi:hypothetical protein
LNKEKKRKENSRIIQTNLIRIKKMKTKEIQEKLRNLRKISPDIISQEKIRKNVFNFARENIPLFDKKPFVFNWSYYIKVGAFSFAFILLLFLGLNSPLFHKDNSDIDFSIKNEWKLADISPYLKNIFGGNDSSQNDLAIREYILDEENKIENLKNSLSVLETSKVDEILDNLIF